MRYEWDEAKRQTNIAKHGVDFRVVWDFDWDTSLRVEVIRGEERRTYALGFVGERLHVVVYTQREEWVRIISMRKANDREFQRYAAT